MKVCTVIFCAVITVTISSDVFKNQESIQNCVKDSIKKTGQEHPDLKNWIDSHQDVVLESLNKFLECRTKHGLLTCMRTHAKKGQSLKEKLEKTVPNGYEKHVDEILEAGKKCILG